MDSDDVGASLHDVELTYVYKCLEALEELIIDSDAFVPGAPIRGLPGCVVRAYQVQCGGSPVALHDELKLTSEVNLTRLYNLAETLLAATRSELEERAAVARTCDM